LGLGSQKRFREALETAIEQPQTKKRSRKWEGRGKKVGQKNTESRHVLEDTSPRETGERKNGGFVGPRKKKSTVGCLGGGGGVEERKKQLEICLE